MTDRTWGPHRLFGLGLLALGVGLALNSILGPLIVDAIDYPFSETVRNETLGLEAISLLLIAPLAIAAGILALRGERTAGIVALGPAAYAAYMLVQYVLGPQYLSYEPAILLHLGLFVLSGALLVRAWTLVDARTLPLRSRGWASLVVLLVAFVFSRWAGALAAMGDAGALSVAQTDVTMYWSIFLLDLGIVVPIAIATAIGLSLARPWAAKLLYGVVGWFALVPPSVAAMAIVKVVRGDPVADVGDAIVLVVMAVVSGAIALVLYVPLFRRGRDRAADVVTPPLRPAGAHR